jgi:hypothetical protein
METKSPQPAGVSCPGQGRTVGGTLRTRPLSRAARTLRRVALATAILLVPGAAIAATVSVKGKLVGAAKLLNPVWGEAKEAKASRYTFREPSPTVRADVRALTSYLPKEVCVVALGTKGTPLNAPLRVVVAGGRTTPVTLVVAEGQQILFENQDPFPHKLYDLGGKGLQAVETGSGKSRTWTPPGPGKYEVRDELAPSVRSWIVVEPKTMAVGFPDRLGNFALDLAPGTYSLRGYHNGEPVGVELPITVTPAPAEQLLRDPLKVAEPDKPKEK